MKSTHWSVKDNPEDWGEDPAECPAMAVECWISENSDDSLDARDELTGTGAVTVAVSGWVETTALLDPEEAFDGYVPGSTYFTSTGETQHVRISITYEDLP
jgi:hypothetical protein